MVQSKIFTMSKFKIMMLFLLTPFFEPQIFNFYFTFDKLFLMWQAMCVVILIFWYLYIGKVSWYVVAIFAWRMYAYVNTFIITGNLYTSSVTRSVFIIGITLAIEIGLKRDSIQLLQCIYIILMVSSAINLITCFTNGITQVGVTSYFFLGMRTRFTDSAVPLVVIAFLLSWVMKKKIVSKITIITFSVVALQLIMQWVATGVFVVFILCLLVLLFWRKSILFSVWIGMFSMIMLNVGVVFYNIQNYFSFIIVDILHKSLTLHGRTPIWQSALYSMQGHFKFGFGESTDGGFVQVLWANRPAPAHNMILQIIHDGGLVSAVLLLLCFCIAGLQLSKYRHEEVSSILSIGITVMGLAMLTEISSYYAYFYVIPVIAFNVNTIIDKKSNAELNVNRESSSRIFS